MADVWSLVEYIESHPDDHEQRWRLAKKLYSEREYRLALEHLQVLRNEWERNLHVERYLGATYFRLTRYARASEALLASIEKWPDDLGLREQLARTFEASGNDNDAAVEAWETVASMDPGHSRAREAVKALKDQAVEEAAVGAIDYEHALLSPAGMDDEAEIECPNCGARNSPEFERCWQCHGVIVASSTSADLQPEQTEQTRSPVIEVASTLPWPLVSGISIVALLTYGVFMTLRDFYSPVVESGAQAVPFVHHSLYAFLLEECQITRVIIGVVLLVVWPVAFRLAAALAGGGDVYASPLHIAGLFLAALAYAASWVSGGAVGWMLIVPAVSSLIICFLAFGVPVARAGLLWLIQGAVVGLVTITVLAATHGFGFVIGLPAILQYAANEQGESVFRHKGVTPVELNIRWEKTGAKWLDEAWTGVEIEVGIGPFEKRLFAGIQDWERTLVYKELVPGKNRFVFQEAVPGYPYRLEVVGQEGIPFTLTVRGILTVKSMPAEVSPPQDSEVSGG